MSLPPTPKIAAAFLGVFLTGAAVGVLSTMAFQDMTLSKFLAHTSDPKKMADSINKKYADQYHLTPDEQNRIRPLTAHMAQQLNQARRRFGAEVVATLDDCHRQIGEQMTPEHRAAYEKVNTERRRKMTRLLLLDSPAAPADKSP